MTFTIVGECDKERQFCVGSFSKLLTTFTCLSWLAEKYPLENILNDENFFDTLATNKKAKEFLRLFQHLIGSRFTLHDICSYYAGLPYTFDVSKEEIERVEAGHAFKHHSIPDEETFLFLCHHHITPVYKNRCKFHYSEISIIFLGFFIESVFSIQMEELYAKYVVDRFQLKNSIFSRKRPENAYVQDLSDLYDYPSIAIVDHGYFCYSNGFYTTLNDMKILLENITDDAVFNHMIDIKNARAASNTLLNGLTIELRLHGDDMVYGYDGLSFSGCNLWAYSTKRKQGYLTFHSDSEVARKIIYHDNIAYDSFDRAPAETEIAYENFLKQHLYPISPKSLPEEFQGNYQRVKINTKSLDKLFPFYDNTMIIRDVEDIHYPIIYANHQFRIQCKDKTHGGKVGLMQSNSGNRYYYYDGVLYKAIL